MPNAAVAEQPTDDATPTAIARDRDTLFPRAATQLVAGDVLMVMADRRSEAALRQFLEGADRNDAIPG